MNEDKNTEQAIFQAAEEIFMEKGYAATKTTEIAKKAGVNHAMIHYYFRTKENLFTIIFKNKVELLANSIFSVSSKNRSFSEIITMAIDSHFDFIRENHKLALFIVNEINNNESNNQIWKEIAIPVFSKVMESIKEMVHTEISTGKIRPIDPVNFMITILSLNIFVFVAQPLLLDIAHFSPKEFDEFLEERKNENIRLALLALKP